MYRFALGPECDNPALPCLEGITAYGRSWGPLGLLGYGALEFMAHHNWRMSMGGGGRPGRRARTDRGSPAAPLLLAPRCIDNALAFAGNAAVDIVTVAAGARAATMAARGFIGLGRGLLVSAAAAVGRAGGLSAMIRGVRFSGRVLGSIEAAGTVEAVGGQSLAGMGAADLVAAADLHNPMVVAGILEAGAQGLIGGSVGSWRSLYDCQMAAELERL